MRISRFAAWLCGATGLLALTVAGVARADMKTVTGKLVDKDNIERTGQPPRIGFITPATPDDVHFNGRVGPLDGIDLTYDLKNIAVLAQIGFRANYEASYDRAMVKAGKELQLDIKYTPTDDPDFSEVDIVIAGQLDADAFGPGLVCLLRQSVRFAAKAESLHAPLQGDEPGTCQRE